MKRILILKVIDKFKINKNFLKFFLISFLNIYSFFISLISIFLFKCLKTRFVSKNRRFISLRITRKYYGHLLIEPAILSSLKSINSNIICLVSYKPSKRINNKVINILLNRCFKFYPDLFIAILEHLYNYSYRYIQNKLSKIYQPLLAKNLIAREITYIKLLETNNKFPWRKTINTLINSSEKPNIIIALRTKHFNERFNEISPQPWRDINKEDLFHIVKILNKIDLGNYKVKILSDLILLEEIEKKFNLKNNFELLDQRKKDFLSIINKNSILINNGNGIGAAAVAIGLRTLYLHHTLYHFWHTSHTNALCYPSLFKYQDKNLTIYESLKLAFSTKEVIPFDFKKNFYSRDFYVNSLKSLSSETLLNLFLETLNYSNNGRSEEIFDGCEFSYSNSEEKDFWKFYISNLPLELKNIHNKITLRISKTFLSDI